MPGITGIDPGDDGAVVHLVNGTVEVYDMPVIKGKRNRPELDIPSLYALIKEIAPDRVVCELFKPMQHALANYKRGGYAYTIRTICHILGIPLDEVPPKDWQKPFGIRNKKGDDTKKQAYVIAKRKFPELQLNGPRGAILDGRADAVLIALYGQQHLNR